MQHPRTKQHALMSLFRFLAGQGIDYCVVGRACPDEDGHGDVDLLVAPGDRRRLRALLPALCTALNASLLRRIRHPQGWRFDLAWHDAAGRPVLLPLDVIGDLTWRGRRVYAAAELLLPAAKTPADSRPDGARRAPPGNEFMYLLAKRLLKRTLDDSAGRDLSALWRADPDTARRATERRFSRSHASLIAAAAQADDWTAVRDRLPALRRALLRGAPPSAAALLDTLRAAARRLSEPTGLVVRLRSGDPHKGALAAQALVAACAPLFERTLVVSASDGVQPASGWRPALRAYPTRLRGGLIVVSAMGPAQSGWWRWLLPRPDIALELDGAPYAAALDDLLRAARAAGPAAGQGVPARLGVELAAQVVEALRRRAARRTGAVA